MIDMTELEAMEDLINQGSDAQVEAWRVSQLSVCGMIAIIVRIAIFYLFTGRVIKMCGCCFENCRGVRYEGARELWIVVLMADL